MKELKKQASCHKLCPVVSPQNMRSKNDLQTTHLRKKIRNLQHEEKQIYPN